MSRRGLAPAIWPGYACALGAAVCWALSATLAKGLFTPGLDALAVAQTRSLLGFVCLWPVLFVVRRPLALPERRHLPLLALFGLNFVALHATYYYSISRMPVAVAILVQYLAPLLILLYTRLFRRAPVGRALWAAALLCLGGWALVAGVRGGVSGIHPDGLAAALASAAAYATYILLAEAGGRRLSPWTLLCCGLGFAALFWGFLRPWGSFPFGILLQPVPHPAGGNGLAVPFPNVGALLLFIAVCGTLLPFGLVALALRRIPAGRAGITPPAEPVVAAGLAYALLGERLGGAQMAGGVLVVAGILLAQYAASPGRAPASGHSEDTPRGSA